MKQEGGHSEESLISHDRNVAPVLRTSTGDAQCNGDDDDDVLAHPHTDKQEGRADREDNRRQKSTQCVLWTADHRCRGPFVRCICICICI